MQQSLGLMPHLAAQVGAIADYLVASPLHHRADRVVPIGDQVGPPGQSRKQHGFTQRSPIFNVSNAARRPPADGPTSGPSAVG